MKTKKITVLIATVLLLLASLFTLMIQVDAQEETTPGIMDAESWSGNAEKDGEILKLNDSSFSTAPTALQEDYLKIEFSLDSMGNGYGDTWANISIINKPMQVSPAGAVDSNGLYFMFYDFGGQLVVSLLHKSPVGEEYKGIQDAILGAGAALGTHTLEVFMLDEVLNIFIDGMQYKRALISGVFKEDFCSIDNNSYLSFASYGGAKISLISVNNHNERDLENPKIQINLASEGFVGETFFMREPSITDNADKSFAVKVEVYDPTGLKIFPKENCFIPSEVGTYKVNYYVIDNSGNEVKASHSVTVTEKESGGCGGAIVGGVGLLSVSLLAVSAAYLLRKKNNVL